MTGQQEEFIGADPAEELATGTSIEHCIGATAMQVKDVAGQASVPAHVVRYYTRIGLLRPQRDPVNKYRLYAPADVSRVKFIRRAKSLGFTLNDVKAILRDADVGISPCPEVREILRKRVQEIESRLKNLKRLKRRLKQAEELWETMPDRPPDHRCLCHLIDAVSAYSEDLT